MSAPVILSPDDLITALNCCMLHASRACEQCPLYGERTSNCQGIMCVNAINTITALNAKIERINASLDGINNAVDAVRNVISG